MSKPCNGQCGSEDSVVDDKFQGRATAETGSQLSTYKIPKMDCPSEERMIRMALTGVENIQSLSFDLSGRTLEIIHHGERCFSRQLALISLFKRRLSLPLVFPG